MTPFYFSCLIVVISVALSFFSCFRILYRDSILIKLFYNIVISILHSFIYVANDKVTHHEHHCCIQVLPSFRYFCCWHNTIVKSSSLSNFVLYILCYFIIQVLRKSLIYCRQIISWLPIVCIV